MDKRGKRTLALKSFLETLFSLQQRTNIVGALLKWPRDWMSVEEMKICSKSIIPLEETTVLSVVKLVF